MFECPSVKFVDVSGTAQRMDDVGFIGTNSLYIDYGIGMWLTYWYGFKSPGRVDMNRFDDLDPFTVDTHSSGEQYQSRQFYSGKPVVRSDGTEVSPSDLAITGDSSYYWWGIATGARYRHHGRANALCLDGSARGVQEIQNAGWIIR